MYDIVAASIEAFSAELPDNRTGLPRRVRHLAVAADVNDDVATVAFLRRGHSGQLLWEQWVLHHRDDWGLIGGGGGTAPPDVLHDRPGEDVLGGVVQLSGVGWALSNIDDPPTAARYVGDARFRFAAEVAAVDIRGVQRPVPRHGYVVAAWWEDAPPTVSMLGSDGRPLGEVDCTSSRR